MMRRLTLTAATSAALLALVLTGCSSTSAGSNTGAVDPGESSTGESTPAEAPAEAPAEPAVPGLNIPVTLGSFEFTVTGSADLGPSIGSSPLSHDAQGTFLQVDLAVKNIGTKSETFFDSYVTLIDNEGKQYDADSMAPIYLDSDVSWALGVNPGNTMAGPVVFDVPAGTVPEFLMVKDNMFTDEGELIALK